MMTPKVENTTTLVDIKPIAFSNTIYECIKNVLRRTIKSTTPWLIDRSQEVFFIASRSIVHNVLMCEDLIELY